MDQQQSSNEPEAETDQPKIQIGGISISGIPNASISLGDISSVVSAGGSIIAGNFEPDRPKDIGAVSSAVSIGAVRIQGEFGPDESEELAIGSVKISRLTGLIHLGNISIMINTGGKILRVKWTDSVQADLKAALTHWRQEIEQRLETLTDLDEAAKAGLREQVIKVEQEVIKGKEATIEDLERWLNAVIKAIPGLLEVTISILQAPFAEVGLALEKLDDLVKLKQKAQAG
jgi:hypothetical protein